MLNQRTFVIMTRTCVENGDTVIPVRSEILGQTNVPGMTGLQTLKYWTKAVPMSDGVALQKGAWVEWHRTRSYVNLLREVRKLLKTLSREDFLVMEIINTDTIIAPRS